MSCGEKHTDPVCNMDVEHTDETPQSEYEGETYFFCCEACKEAFDQEPEKYAP